MKKILLSLLMFILLARGINAQNIAPKLSPLTKKYLKEIRSKNEDSRQINNYVYKHSGNKTYISGLIKVNNNIDDAQLNLLGVKIGTRAGNIWTAQIPVESIESFIHLNGIEYIQLDEPAFPDLDLARSATRVDSVHAGYGLPMPYNGEGVVVGVIDAGFDFSHPIYFDTTGSGYRVKKVWMQKNNTGPAPSGYAYGTDVSDSTTLWNIGNDNGESHGTHVSGICAGAGFGSPQNGTMFRGVAYKSDIVLVGISPDKSQWVSTGVSDMIDGINYVFSYANSVGKPAVANLSWGSPLGPHDGTGLFSQAVDNLTGPGKIFVCSAGNNGSDYIHVQKSFSPSDTLAQTFLQIADSPEGLKTWVDIWGDTGKTFCVQVSLYNGSQIASTGFICLDDTVHDLFLLGTNNDTCFVSFSTSSAEFNMKPRIFLDFDNRASDVDTVSISVKANDGTIHIWNSFVSNSRGYYGNFTWLGYPWAISGDPEITISDIASSKSAISVGAYVSKIEFTNINSATYLYNIPQGVRAPFSSHGPTTDGRIKPDITAPGFTLGSSFSSYDSTYLPAGPGYTYVVNIYADPVRVRDYPFGQLSGTSMAAPMVSGISAMLLQLKNDLDPQQLKDIFAETAITDNFTGIIPPGGDSLWGNGKVNAYGSVNKVLQIVNGINNPKNNFINCNLFPNPNDGSFTLNYSGNNNESLEIELFNVIGKKLFSEKWKTNVGLNFKTIDVRNISGGIYFIKISSQHGQSIIRMIISK